MNGGEAPGRQTVAGREPGQGQVECRPGRVRLALTRTPASVAEARRAVDTLLSAEPRPPELRERLRLVVSELMTNAVVHGAQGEEIQLDLTLYVQHVHVSVSNAGSPIDLASFRRRRVEGGRGLVIVAALVDGWSIETGPKGTTVTARVPRAP
jgi:anti-sigma regulatory factor (Ser/Thr protein kinase)